MKVENCFRFIVKQVLLLNPLIDLYESEGVIEFKGCIFPFVCYAEDHRLNSLSFYFFKDLRNIRNLFLCFTLNIEYPCIGNVDSLGLIDLVFKLSNCLRKAVFP